MKRLLSGFSTLIFLFIYSSNSHALVDLWDWVINIDGTSYCFEGPCSSDFLTTGDLVTLGDLPSSIDYSTFNIRDDQSSDFDGLGSH